MSAGVEAGLCPRCRHVRRIVSGRGSLFLMCRLSAEDRRFAKYPPQPISSCPAFEQADAAEPRDPGDSAPS